jgi:hypothetical protein
MKSKRTVCPLESHQTQDNLLTKRIWNDVGHSEAISSAARQTAAPSFEKQPVRIQQTPRQQGIPTQPRRLFTYSLPRLSTPLQAWEITLLLVKAAKEVQGSTHDSALAYGRVSGARESSHRLAQRRSVVSRCGGGRLCGPHVRLEIVEAFYDE